MIKPAQSLARGVLKVGRGVKGQSLENASNIIFLVNGAQALPAREARAAVSARVGTSRLAFSQVSAAGLTTRGLAHRAQGVNHRNS